MFPFQLIGWFFQGGFSTLCTSSTSSIFSPALALPAVPLPHPLSDCQTPPASRPSPLPRTVARRACTGQSGPEEPWPSRSDHRPVTHGAPARSAEADVTVGNVTSPPGVLRPVRPVQHRSQAIENALLTGVNAVSLGVTAPTGIDRALTARGRRPAVWGRTHEACGSSACGASYTHLSYGQPHNADNACAQVDRSKIFVENLINQTASKSNVESTLTRTKQLTDRSNNEPNTTTQLQNLHESQIMKEPRVSVARAETFLTVSS